MTTDEMIKDIHAMFANEPGRRVVRITMDFWKSAGQEAESKAAELQAQLAEAFSGYGFARECTGRLVSFIITRP